MKNLAQNIFWLIIVSFIVFIVLSKIEQNTVKCVDSIADIDKKLISGESFVYEINQD